MRIGFTNSKFIMRGPWWQANIILLLLKSRQTNQSTEMLNTLWLLESRKLDRSNLILFYFIALQLILILIYYLNKCSTSCGQKGTQTRTVECYLNSTNEATNEKHCSNIDTPSRRQECENQCKSEWKIVSKGNVNRY